MLSRCGSERLKQTFPSQNGLEITSLHSPLSHQLLMRTSINPECHVLFKVLLKELIKNGKIQTRSVEYTETGLTTRNSACSPCCMFDVKKSVCIGRLQISKYK